MWRALTQQKTHNDLSSFLASFPGLLTVQFLQHAKTGGVDNWMVGRPGNKAPHTLLCKSGSLGLPHSSLLCYFTVQLPDLLSRIRNGQLGMQLSIVKHLKLLLESLHSVGNIHHTDVASRGRLVRRNVGHLSRCSTPSSLQPRNGAH